jgi:HEAT repeat protein
MTSERPPEHQACKLTAVVPCIALALAWVLQSSAQASPPPTLRSLLPQIETQLNATDAKLQLQGLTDLASIERGITKDLIRLLPRALELCSSGDEKVATAALYLTGQFAWLPEARREYGQAMIEALARAMDSRHAEVRGMAIYSANAALMDEQMDRALPMLLAAARDSDEKVRGNAVIVLGKIAKANEKIIAVLGKSLSDPAMQVRRQAAFSLSKHPEAAVAVMAELLQAVRDPSGEVSGSATHALQQMGEAAVDDLLNLADDPKPDIRGKALHALATSYATMKLSDESGRRISAMVQRKLKDPDATIQAAAATRIAYFGSLEGKAAAVPILVKHATDKESLNGWNAFIGLHRCIRAFTAGLTDKEKAGAAFRGLQKFDKGFLKTYLLESQQKFKGLEGGDVRPLFEAAAQHGIEAEHRALAKEVLTWLADN